MYTSVGKRLLDLLFSIIGIIVVVPVILLACLVILVVDGFPCFYIQRRIGRNGVSFDLYKIRTMKINADKFGSTTYGFDSRIVFGGGLFRKFKIDELPQLLNVIKGDMSIIGPRPTVTEDYELMNEEQRRRNLVRPGLTGLAQISGNTGLTWPERIKFDLKYIDSLSFMSDLRILLQTVLMILTNRIDSDPPAGGEW